MRFAARPAKSCEHSPTDAGPKSRGAHDLSELGAHDLLDIAGEFVNEFAVFHAWGPPASHSSHANRDLSAGMLLCKTGA